MRFDELPLSGAYLITLEPSFDDRGYFARTFCIHEFERFGLQTAFVQMSTCMNAKQGQVRGMHYQAAPHQETKLVRCTQGALLDVIVDLRPKSVTYKQHIEVTLSATNHQMLYVPKDFAHGYKTLEPNTEIFYMMDNFYHPESAKEIPSDEYF